MPNIIRNNIQKLFVVAVSEMVLFFTAQALVRFILRPVWHNIVGKNDVETEFLQIFTILMFFSIHILLCVIFVRIFKPEAMKYFVFKPKQALVGLAIGTLVNAIISIGAVMGTGMTVSYRGFTMLLLPLFFANIVQCAGEEVLLRAFVPSFLEEEYSWDVIALLSGVLFIFHHVVNLRNYGFSSVFCLNVFLTGAMLILVVKYTRNMWWAVGFHSGWNFTQEYIFGLPNSGQSSSLAIFKSENPCTNFFFDEVYGNEGSQWSIVVILIAIVLLSLYFSKYYAKKSNQ